MPLPGTPRAFTLIELLVVITIIVVLLALLSPALERAVYQAQLTACQAQLRGMGSGVVTRAMEYQRRYPRRFMVHGTHEQPTTLRWSGTVAAGGPVVGFVGNPEAAGDDRALLRPYVQSLDMLMCPLVGGKQDLEKSTSLLVRGSYPMWFGWQIYKAGGASEKGMNRIGDRWEFRGRRFSVIASDWDFRQQAGTIRAYASHPDRDGQMALGRYENADWTHARWELNGTHKRPPVDLNFTYDDLSAERINELHWDESTEERTVAVPWRAADNAGEYDVNFTRVYVPPR